MMRLSGVIGSWGDGERQVGADQRAEQLDDALIPGVGLEPEATGEITVEAMLGAAGMPAFVQQDGIVRFAILEPLELGYL